MRNFIMQFTIIIISNPTIIKRYKIANTVNIVKC